MVNQTWIQPMLQKSVASKTSAIQVFWLLNFYRRTFLWMFYCIVNHLKSHVNSIGLMFLQWFYHVFHFRKARSETKTSDSTSFAGFLSSGRSLTLPGRNSPISTTVSYQTVDIPISGTHSLSLPNLQQHCGLSDNGFEPSSVVADTINSEWVSLMTSMNLGEVGDVEDSGESRSV